MGAGGHILWLGEEVPPPALLTYLCPGGPCFGSSDVFLFCWAAFLSISLLASVFPVSLPLFFLFLRPCLIHARMPDWGRAFVHGHTFLHSWTHFLAFMERGFSIIFLFIFRSIYAVAICCFLISSKVYFFIS